MADDLNPEERARVLVDGQLARAGWYVCDRDQRDLVNHRGNAVREVIMDAGHSRADYLLYVDRKIVGVIEAKPVGTPLTGVQWQSAMYAAGLPEDLKDFAILHDDRLPFVFEASGSETQFTNGFDPSPRARKIFNFPKPETLARIIRDAEADPDAPDVESESPTDATVRPLRTAGRPVRCGGQHREVVGCSDSFEVAGADGDWCRQDPDGGDRRARGARRPRPGRALLHPGTRQRHLATRHRRTHQPQRRAMSRPHAIDAFYRQRLGEASRREAEYLAAVARFGDGPQRSADIAEELEQTPAAVSGYRARLIRTKGLLIEPRRGPAEFALPGMGEWLRNHPDEQR